MHDGGTEREIPLLVRGDDDERVLVRVVPDAFLRWVVRALELEFDGGGGGGEGEEGEEEEEEGRGVGEGEEAEW